MRVWALTQTADSLGVRIRARAAPFQPGKRLVSSSTRHALSSVAFFTVLYWSCTWVRSDSKPLWFDELFTYYMAQLPIAEQLAALRSGIETNPPGLPWLVRMSHALWGISELSTRLASMISYYVFCILVFAFVRRRLTLPLACVALVLPLGLGAYTISYEARAYALMLAAAMVTFIGWQNRLLNFAPRFGLLLVGLGTLVGVLGHYFAVFMIVMPVAIAECVRGRQRRRIDWPFWITLCGAMGPLLYLAPLARVASPVFTQVVASAPSFWARPTILKLPAFYWTQLQGLAVPAAIALVVGLCLDRSQEADKPRSGAAKSKPEIFLIGALLAVPGVLLAVAWLWTGTYVHRYAITGAIGIVMGICWLLDRLRWINAACALIAVTAVSFVFSTARAGSHRFNIPLPPPAVEQGLPLVISDPLRYLVLAHYRPKGMRAAPVYLTNRTAAITLPDFIPEISLDLGKSLFPVDVRDYRHFTRTNPRFYVEDTREATREWLPRQLRRDKFTLTTVSRTGTRTLLLASRACHAEP